MRKVYKIELKAGYNSIVIPPSFEILDVDVSYDEPYLLVVGEDNLEPLSTVDVALLPSGGLLYEDECEYKYISTVSLFGGATILHAFLLERK